jgi:hypothetical protein
MLCRDSETKPREKIRSGAGGELVIVSLEIGVVADKAAIARPEVVIV